MVPSSLKYNFVIILQKESPKIFWEFPPINKQLKISETYLEDSWKFLFPCIREGSLRPQPRDGRALPIALPTALCLGMAPPNYSLLPCPNNFHMTSQAAAFRKKKKLNIISSSLQTGSTQIRKPASTALPSREVQAQPLLKA